MQLLNFSLGLAALLTTANAQYYGYGGNSTSSSVTRPVSTSSKSSESTSYTTIMSTKTFYSTMTETITSCRSTVTNCPAESTRTITKLSETSRTTFPVSTRPVHHPFSVHTPGSSYGASSTAPSQRTTTRHVHSTSTVTQTHTVIVSPSPVPSGHKSGHKTKSTTTKVVDHTSTKYNTVWVTSQRPSVSDQGVSKSHTATHVHTHVVTVTPVPVSEYSSYHSKYLASPTGTGVCSGGQVTVTETQKETVYVTMHPSAQQSSPQSAYTPVPHSPAPHHPGPHSSEKSTSTTTLTRTRTQYSTSTVTVHPKPSTSALSSKLSSPPEHSSSLLSSASTVAPTTTSKHSPSSIETPSSYSSASSSSSSSSVVSPTSKRPVKSSSSPYYPNPTSTPYTSGATGFITKAYPTPYPSIYSA